MTMLTPYQNNEYQPSTAGTIGSLAKNLMDEMEFNGDSVSYEDVEKSIIDHTILYAGWQPLHCQKTATQAIPVDENCPLILDEWSILEPVIRAHLDMLHAKRTDGSGAISGERTGKDPMTAEQDYNTRKEEMAKKAFCDEVYSV